MADAVQPGDAIPGYHINPSGNEAKELSKWEQFPKSYTTVHGVGNPYVYRPYPKMLYKAGHFKGKVVCGANEPNASEYSNLGGYHADAAQAKMFNESCQKIVQNDIEHSRAMEDGWRESPAEAVNHALAVDKSIADHAAMRNYEDRNMSEMAKREIQAASDAVGGEHLPEIERKPIRKGGWPKGMKRTKKATEKAE